MAKPNSFTAIWKQMEKAVEARDREGWESEKSEQAHKALLQALWIAAHNPEHPVILEIVQKYSDALKRARAEPREPAGPNGEH